MLKPEKLEEREDQTVKYFRVSLVAILAVVFVASLFFANGCAKKEPETIKIGAILPLTGPISIIGVPEKNAMIIAEEWINRNGGINGIPLEIIFEDFEKLPKKAVDAATKLININNVKILMASTSISSHVIAPIVKDKDCILFTITTEPGLADGRNIFRFWPNAEQEAQLLWEFIKKEKITKTALMYPNNELGNFIKTFFVDKFKGDGSLEPILPHDVGTKDFRPHLIKLKKENYDWILGWAYPNDTYLIIKQARELKIKSKFITSIGTSWPFVWKKVDELKESPIFVTGTFDLETSTSILTKKFLIEYKNRYGEEPNWNAAFAFDNVWVLKAILKNNKSLQAKEIVNTINKIKSFEGVTGKLEILPSGDAKTELSLVTIKGGKLEPVGDNK